MSATWLLSSKWRSMQSIGYHEAFLPIKCSRSRRSSLALVLSWLCTCQITSHLIKISAVLLDIFAVSVSLLLMDYSQDAFNVLSLTLSLLMILFYGTGAAIFCHLFAESERQVECKRHHACLAIKSINLEHQIRDTFVDVYYWTFIVELSAFTSNFTSKLIIITKSVRNGSFWSFLKNVQRECSTLALSNVL